MGMGRVLAALIAHHGDDNGLVLPPIVAPKQLVIVPIPFKGREKDVAVYAEKIEARLKEAGVRVVFDDDDRLRPGEKFYKWDMFGVPVRVEVGPKEAKAGSITIVRRDTRERSEARLESIVQDVRKLFEDIYANLRARSWQRLESEMVAAGSLEELKTLIEQRKIAKVNWCGDPQCAYELKGQVTGEVRGTLWERHEVPTGTPCIVCGEPANEVAYVARSY
jgi:prolyl-tRNA synthetase